MVVILTNELLANELLTNERLFVVRPRASPLYS
jgi:hypothetical protein